MLLCQIFRLDGERWMDGRYGSGDVGGSEVARVILFGHSAEGVRERHVILSQTNVKGLVALIGGLAV